MKSAHTFFLALAMAVSALAAADDKLLQGTELCVMTYNLRYASSSGPNSWPTRRPLVKERIEASTADVFGTQEGLYEQLKDLANDLPDYAWIGLGRDGGSKGEFMAVFYRKGRLEPVAFDHFWLSDTPDVIASTTWGNSNRRMVTWVRFKEKTSGREFYFVNTHFDHQVQAAREKAAALVKERIQSLSNGIPVILVGDFNAVAGANKAYAILTGDDFLADTWGAARERVGEGLATFNGFKAIVKTGERIDWILTRGPVTTDKIQIDSYSKDGQFPSDHFPVVAWIRVE
jgi:endonuclease/exonuclease/phosphatase family metal-dependent hydrolase